MKKIFISGLLNYETSVDVNEFPINYQPIHYPFFKLNSNISGVAYNILESLITLGNKPLLYSMLSNDLIGNIIKLKLDTLPIRKLVIDEILKSTPETVVMYDNRGKRSVYCDLKDIQDKKVLNNEAYKSIDESDMLILCNTNFNRDLLTYAKSKNKLIASDVHVLSNIDDEYNLDYIKNTDILFLSDEALIDPYIMMNDLILKHNKKIICISRGSKGVLFYDKDKKDIIELDSYKDIKVVNTVGAGDALFSSFIHFYLKEDPLTSIKKAIIYAALKIESSGGSKGFKSEEEVNSIYNKIYANR